MSYLGDFYLGANIDTKFTTVNTSGVPTMLTGSPAVVAYPDNSTTELTAGISLTTNFDGRSGLNHVRVQATGANGYATGTNYSLVLASGTVGGNFVGGYAVREFSIEARAALRPAQDGRDVALSPDGLVDVNDKTGFSLSNPQTFNLNGYVGTVTGSVQSVTNPVTVGTNNDKTGYSLSSPQAFDLIGNVSGTLTNVNNVINPVTVGANNDKIGYSLSSPQNFNWIGNLSGTWVGNQIGHTIGNTSGTWMGNISGTVGAVNGLVTSRLDVPISSRMATGTMVNANLKQIDEQATNGNNATLKLKHLDIQSSDGNPSVLVFSTDNIALEIDTTGVGFAAIAVQSVGDGSNTGATLSSTGAGLSVGAGSGNAVEAQSTGGNGHGLSLIGQGTGKSINAPQGIQGNLLGDVYGNVTGTSGIATGSFINAIADQVWDEQIAGHLITGSTGKKLNDAGSAGDPWGTSLPASYTPGQAGYILGTNLNDTVSSRMPSGSMVRSNVKQVNDVTLQGDGSTTPWGPV